MQKKFKSKKCNKKILEKYPISNCKDYREEKSLGSICIFNAPKYRIVGF